MDTGSDQGSGNSSDEGRTDREAEETISSELDLADRNCLLAFENCSSAITHLHRDRLRNEDSWSVFQNAAGCVTSLYKEAVDSRKKAYDLGMKMGMIKKTKELRQWARKYKMRQISKDELMSCLPGMSPPPRARPSPQRSRSTSRANATLFDFGSTATLGSAFTSSGVQYGLTTPFRNIQSTGNHMERDNFNHAAFNNLTDDIPGRQGEKRGRSQYEDPAPWEPSPKRKPRNF